MKKILVIIGIVVLLFAAALAIFIATFDIDKYRPAVIEQIQRTTGQPVRIGKLSLGWRGGVSVEAGRFSLGQGSQPLIEVEKGRGVIRLMPLLRGQVQVGSVTLVKPSVYAERRADGTINLMEFLPKKVSQKQGASSQSKAGSVAAFFIGLIKVEGGTIRVKDLARPSPVDLTVRHLEMSVRNVSLTRLIDVELKAALFGDDQNIRLKGKIHPPLGDKPAWLENFRGEIDLSTFKKEQIEMIYPPAKQFGLEDLLAGNLTVEIETLPFDPAALAQVKAKIGLTGGKIAGNIAVEHIDSEPKTGFDLKAQDLLLERFVPAAKPEEPSVRGRFSGSFKGEMQGLDLDRMARTLGGKGTFSLADGVLVNLNVLREVFQRFSMIQGLEENLMARLPESYRQKFTAQDTALKNTQMALSAAGGVFTFDNLKIQTEEFELNGACQAGLDGSMNGSAVIKIEPQLSAAMVASVKELKYLADEQGCLEFPVMIQGRSPKISVLPDLNYLTQHLLATKVQDLVGDLLERAFEKKEKKE